MSLENQVWRLSTEIEQLMQESTLWNPVPPALTAFDSHEPFCIDTMEPEEWLQWVFIPRMRAILESEQPLPTNIAITPYFEVSFAKRCGDFQPLIAALQNIDQVLNKENNQC